jgi:hypothetical protein
MSAVADCVIRTVRAERLVEPGPFLMHNIGGAPAVQVEFRENSPIRVTSSAHCVSDYSPVSSAPHDAAARRLARQLLSTPQRDVKERPDHASSIFSAG